MKLEPGEVNAVYAPHFWNEHRYQIYYGGSSSGKSCFLATRAVTDCLRGRNYLILRGVARTLRASCWNEVLKAVNRLGLARWFEVNKSEMTVTARSNGCQLLFAGLDDVEKIKSITPRSGPLTDVWIEEATECARADFKQLDKRLRGLTRHPKRMTLSFNPISRQHWIYQEFFAGRDPGSKYWECGDVSVLRTTYQDNQFLTDDDRRALEAEQDAYFAQVYTRGEWGAMEGTIFTNWRVADLSAERGHFLPLRYGLDFGFAADPTAAITCAWDPPRRRVLVFQELYQQGLTNLRLAELLRGFCGRAPIICDSAEPKSIQELRELGIAAFPARKGPDSVLHGIQWLRGCEIVVDTACAALQRELAAYAWQRAPAGGLLPRPADRDNHLIDALRYALEDVSSERAIRTGV